LAPVKAHEVVTPHFGGVGRRYIESRTHIVSLNRVLPPGNPDAVDRCPKGLFDAAGLRDGLVGCRETRQGVAISRIRTPL